MFVVLLSLSLNLDFIAFSFPLVLVSLLPFAIYQDNNSTLALQNYLSLWNCACIRSIKLKKIKIMIPTHVIYYNRLWVCLTVAISGRQWLGGGIVWKGNNNFSKSRHFNFSYAVICCPLLFETGREESGNSCTPADLGNP